MCLLGKCAPMLYCQKKVNGIHMHAAFPSTVPGSSRHSSTCLETPTIEC